MSLMSGVCGDIVRRFSSKERIAIEKRIGCLPPK
jgi:hypothetical protein